MTNWECILVGLRVNNLDGNSFRPIKKVEQCLMFVLFQLFNAPNCTYSMEMYRSMNGQYILQVIIAAAEPEDFAILVDIPDHNFLRFLLECTQQFINY